MEWERILADSVKDGRIKELHLKKIPILTGCENWKSVEVIGWVDHPMKLTHYKGGLVRLNGKIYFVTDKMISALTQFVKWKFTQRIEVTKD